MKKIDVYQCDICSRTEYREHEQITINFMNICPNCKGRMQYKESFYRIDDKGGK